MPPHSLRRPRCFRPPPAPHGTLHTTHRPHRRRGFLLGEARSLRFGLCRVLFGLRQLRLISAYCMISALRAFVQRRSAFQKRRPVGRVLRRLRFERGQVRFGRIVRAGRAVLLQVVQQDCVVHIQGRGPARLIHRMLETAEAHRRRPAAACRSTCPIRSSSTAISSSNCVDVLLDRIDLRLQRIAAGAFLRYIIAQPFKLRIVFRFRRIQLLELCLPGRKWIPPGRTAGEAGWNRAKPEL